MMQFPWIEPLFKFLNKRSPVYWAWLAILGINALALSSALASHGVSEAKLLGGICILVYIVPIPFVEWCNRRWAKTHKPEDKTSGRTS